MTTYIKNKSFNAILNNKNRNRNLTKIVTMPLKNISRTIYCVGTKICTPNNTYLLVSKYPEFNVLNYREYNKYGPNCHLHTCFRKKWKGISSFAVLQKPLLILENVQMFWFWNMSKCQNALTHVWLHAVSLNISDS